MVPEPLSVYVLVFTGLQRDKAQDLNYPTSRRHRSVQLAFSQQDFLNEGNRVLIYILLATLISLQKGNSPQKPLLCITMPQDTPHFGRHMWLVLKFRSDFSGGKEGPSFQPCLPSPLQTAHVGGGVSSRPECRLKYNPYFPTTPH